MKHLQNRKKSSFNCEEDSVTTTQEKSSLTDKKLEWLTSVEAANYLKIPIGTLRNMTSNGRIPFYKVGHLNRYLLDDLVSLLLKNKRGATL